DGRRALPHRADGGGEGAGASGERLVKKKPSGNMLLDIAGLIGSRLMLVIFGFGTGIITARLLGPHDRGLFTLLVMLPQTLVTFAKMGVAQANVYYIRRAKVPVSVVASN